MSLLPSCVVCDRYMDAYGRDGAKCHSCHVDTVIERFNADPPADSYARRPILATDCDYEIVRRSGVQGMRL